MAKYRKRPVIIDAIPCHLVLYFAGNEWKSLPDWLVKAYDDGKILFRIDKINITTLEGVMTAEPGDMLIRGVQGEIYPCKRDIFAATYEYVDETEGE